MQETLDKYIEEYARCLDPTVKLPLGNKIKKRISCTPMFQGFVDYMNQDFSVAKYSMFSDEDPEFGVGYLEGFSLKLEPLKKIVFEKTLDEMFWDIPFSAENLENLDGTINQLVFSKDIIY